MNECEESHRERSKWSVVKQWRWVTLDGVRRLKVTCPGCLKEALLDHEVDEQGKVTPSLDCPLCDFHDMAVLEGWTGAG